MTKVARDNKSLYRMADLDVLPAGRSTALLRSRSVVNRGSMIVEADIAALLQKCSEFKTIDEHVDLFLRDQRAERNETRRKYLREQLSSLVSTWVLVSWNSLLELANTWEGSIQRSSGITTIGFPTSDRPQLLRRCVETYAAIYTRTRAFVLTECALHIR